MSQLHQPFQSQMKSTFERFLAHKRALGRRYDTEEYALRLFDRFISDNQIATPDEITVQVVEAFLISRPRRRPRSFNHLLGVVRRLFDWLVVQGEIDRSPPLPRPRRETSGRLPFLFDAAQMRQMLAAAGSLHDRPHARLRGPTYRTIFGLLYGLGLRVGEATRLCTGDVDHDRQLLIVRKTRFSKTRLVPFGPRMAAHVRQYVALVEAQRGPLDPPSPVFSFMDGKPISRSAIGRVFRILVSELGFTGPNGTLAPRVHDLRHSFAVGTLLRWYRQGLDPRQRLIHLSTFLGHVHPDTTAVYLTITEELLHQAGHRFERLVSPVVERAKT